MRCSILLLILLSSATLASPAPMTANASPQAPVAAHAPNKAVTVVKTSSKLITVKPKARSKARVVSGTDNRIHALRYVPEAIVLLQGHLGYQTQIIFSEDETVQNVSIGDSLAWQAVPVNNRLFIKPVTASDTNMTVLTNLRSYNFELQVNGNVTPTYEIRFLYPELQVASTKPIHPSRYNIRYSYSGDSSQVPTELFDDGQFTYFKFPQGGLHALPALFRVEKNRELTLLDYHMQGDYVVVNRVAKQFLLQNGEHKTCIFNDDAIGDAERIHS